MESVLAPPAPSTSTTQQPGTLWRFSADDYHRMADLGILAPDVRVELIDGYIHAMSPVNARHLFTVNRLTAYFHQLLGSRSIISPQNPIRLDDWTEPEPDLALLHATVDQTGVPGADDVLLVVEVSDSTLQAYRDVKAPRYAAAGIAEFWSVNLEAQEVEVYLEAGKDGYRRKQTYDLAATIPLQAFPDIAIEVRRILVA